MSANCVQIAMLLIHECLSACVLRFTHGLHRYISHISNLRCKHQIIIILSAAPNIPNVTQIWTPLADPDLKSKCMIDGTHRTCMLQVYLNLATNLSVSHHHQSSILGYLVLGPVPLYVSIFLLTYTTFHFRRYISRYISERHRGSIRSTIFLTFTKDSVCYYIHYSCSIHQGRIIIATALFS